MADIQLSKGDRLEDLQYKGLKILQNEKLYTFTSDSVVLANFIKGKEKDVAVEIGAGCGVISILVHAKTNINKIFAFEIQKEMANICEKNLKLNDFNKEITLINDDIKNYEKYISKASADIVFSNPPYFKETDFEQSKIKKIAKEEVKLNCKQLVELASQILKNGGSFYCCYLASRSAELIQMCQNNNLTVKEMFFTENGKGQVKLIVLKCVKGGRNEVVVYPNLITNEENGDYLEILHTKYTN